MVISFAIYQDIVTTAPITAGNGSDLFTYQLKDRAAKVAGNPFMEVEYLSLEGNEVGEAV